MNRWNNKVAIVTGASFGIGAAIAKNLAQSGLKVVGIARRSERIEEHARTLIGSKGKLIARKVDLTKEKEIIDCFKWTTKNVGPVSVLINNAIVIQNTRLIDGDTEIWRQILDTNILSYAIAAREAYQVMTENNIDGHIVNINSIGGHQPIYAPGMSLYGPSKFAVTCFSELLRKELLTVDSKIKVTNLSPGLVNTNAAEGASDETRAAFELMPKLESEHVAEAVNYVLSTPPEVQISQLTLKSIEEVI